jgi:hypothetical protein
MRKLLIGIAIVLAFALNVEARGLMMAHGGAVAAGSSAKTIVITEPFTYSNGYIEVVTSSVWLETYGNTPQEWSIGTNTAVCNSDSWSQTDALHTTSVGSANQFIKATLTFDANTLIGFVLRATNITTHFYYLFFGTDTGGAWWGHGIAAGASTTGTDIVADGASGLSSGDSVGVTITGSGNSVVIRIWKNPTANAPISVTEWDSGDSTPDLSITTDPGTDAVDSGNLVGVSCAQSTGGVGKIDNFYAGSVD